MKMERDSFGWIVRYGPRKKRLCARQGCPESEFRIDGYCSLYCRDLVGAREDALLDAIEMVKTTPWQPKGLRKSIIKNISTMLGKESES